jgi:hypothetical protein
MAKDLAALQISLDLQTAAFQKGMKQATNQMGRFNTRAKSIDRQMKSAGRSMSTFLKSAVAFAGLSFSTTFLRGIISTNSALAKQADAVGIGIEQWQEYNYAANRAGVTSAQLGNNFQVFAKRVGEARAKGVGPMVTELKALDNQLLLNVRNADDQDQAFRLVADAIKDAGDATEAAAIANAAFGRSAIPMVNMLREGAEGLDAQAKMARQLGLVIGEDLVRAAESHHGHRFSEDSQICHG